MKLPLETLRKVLDMASEGADAIRAFVEAQNADKHCKRTEFEAEYAAWCKSAFLRTLQWRTAREEDFKNRLQSAIIDTSNPPDSEIMLAASMLQAACSAPMQVPRCLAFMKQFLSKELYEDLQDRYSALWPSAPEEATEGDE